MTLKRMLGLDTRADRYSYAIDQVAGYVSAQNVPDKWIATTCGYCSVGCGMYIGVKGGRAVSVRGNPDHPVNRGMLCPKGLSEHHTIVADNRARYPLLRKNGERVRVSWDEALTTMASRFRETQARYGPESVGVISTGQLVTEEFYALGKLVQLGIGTRNIDGNTTLCMATAVSGYKRSFGSDGPPGAYEDLERADVILLIGANVAENHPILCWRLRSNPNATLIVVDPRVTKTAMLADLHLPLKPRSDLALVNGLIHYAIENDLVDHEYVARHTTGFAALRESVRGYTPNRVAEITGVAAELICRTAWTYARARAGFIAWTMGVNHSTKGTETVNAINNLALITGNIGRAGAAPFSITGQCNAMGTREAGFASSLPGYRKFEDADDRRELARLWGVAEERIPASRGLAYPDIIEAALGAPHSCALDHRHQSRRIVSQLRLPAPGAGGARLPGRAGRISPHAHVRVRAPDAAGGNVGREGGDVHQLRAAGEQGQSRGAAARGSASRLRHLPGPCRRPRRGRRALSRLDEAGRRIRGMETRFSGPSLRLFRHDLQGHRAVGRPSMAAPDGDGLCRT
jgi:assimilatory nitrate reductase catalytic subunit